MCETEPEKIRASNPATYFCSICSELQLTVTTVRADASPKKTANRPLQLRGFAHPERLQKLRIYFMDELKCVTAGMRRLCSPPVQNQQQLTAQIYFWASVAVLKKITTKKNLFACRQGTTIAAGGAVFSANFNLSSFFVTSH